MGVKILKLHPKGVMYRCYKVLNRVLKGVIRVLKDVIKYLRVLFKVLKGVVQGVERHYLRCCEVLFKVSKGANKKFKWC